jgi:phage gpG-like protein
MFPIEIIPRLRSTEPLRYLDRLGKRAGPALVGDVLREWVPIVHGEINRQFEVGGDPRWKANRPSAVEGKGHSRVLFGKGGDSTIKRTIFVIYQAGAHGGSVTVGQGTRYGIFHQEGRPGTWLIPRDPNHPTYSFMIGNRWVTIGRGRQIRHPGLPRRSFIVVGLRMSRMLAATVWEQLRKFQ